MALSMAVNHCKPIPHDLQAILCYWEYEGKMRLNFPKGEAKTKDGTVKTDLLHWGTRFTRTELYKKQIKELNCLENVGGSTCLLLIDIKYGVIFALQAAARFVKRAWNKGLLILHLK